MNYNAKKETIYTMTRYERKKIEKLRKISILKHIPFNEWTSWELKDLIEEYELYFGLSLIYGSPVSLYQFLYNGIYEEESIYEELKSNVLKSSVVESKNIKSVKLKKV